MWRMENEMNEEQQPVQPGDETMKIDLSSSADETQKIDVPVEENPEPAATEPEIAASDSEEAAVPPKRRRRVGLWFLGGFLLLVLTIGLSALLGYYRGIQNRTNLESTQVAASVEEQFLLGVQQMEAGNYERARLHFDYVIGLNPDYPEVIEKQAQVLLIINATATPTPQPTATPTQAATPTPDLRGEEEMFAQARDYLLNEEWDEAIVTLENLRKKNPDFHPLDIDGMLYVAFRNRGYQKITYGELEEGNYDLSVAEGFGPLDTDADSLRTWSRLYITGASFWEVNWGQAAYYFGQVAPYYPNLQDSNGWTASARYIEALTKYAEQLVAEEDYCAAEEQYIYLYEATGDESLQEIIDEVADICR